MTKELVMTLLVLCETIYLTRNFLRVFLFSRQSSVEFISGTIADLDIVFIREFKLTDVSSKYKRINYSSETIVLNRWIPRP